MFTEQVASELQNPSNKVSEITRWISRGPTPNVIKFSSYLINGTLLILESVITTRTHKIQVLALLLKLCKSLVQRIEIQLSVI